MTYQPFFLPPTWFVTSYIYIIWEFSQLFNTSLLNIVLVTLWAATNSSLRTIILKICSILLRKLKQTCSHPCDQLRNHNECFNSNFSTTLFSWWRKGMEQNFDWYTHRNFVSCCALLRRSGIDKSITNECFPHGTFLSPWNMMNHFNDVYQDCTNTETIITSYEWRILQLRKSLMLELYALNIWSCLESWGMITLQYHDDLRKNYLIIQTYS